MNRVLPVFLLIMIPFLQCKTQPAATNKHETGKQDNSQNSLDWPGTYGGVLPCADCPGIETEIVLNKNLQFIKKTKWLGKSDESRELSGTFSWNADGNRITLDVPGGNPGKELYLVGENKIIMLDIEGNRIAGDLANQYILGKLNTAILEKYWKLTELHGRSIPVYATVNREPHIIFKDKDNRVNGNGGCNNFSGTYILKSNDRITLSKIMSTLMACKQMETENEFFKVLQMADNYYVSGDTLILNKARMAPLARFQAVYFK
jgi:heat shock protein HslJ